MTCDECKESMPFDPTFHSGKFGYCSCDYCSKPSSERENKSPVVHTFIYRHSNMNQQEHDILEQLVRRVSNLEKKTIIKKSINSQSSGYKGIR